MRGKRIYRVDLPSGRWFGVKSAPAHGEEGYSIAVGNGYRGSGNWTVVGPSIPSSREADRLALSLFDAFLPHARREDEERAER